MEKHTFKGADYSIVVKDFSDAQINPGIRIRFFENELAKVMGVPCLDAIDLSVDEVVVAIKNYVSKKN